ncbi:MAG: inositol monophosphatase family protein [Myxococcota bacterium]
MTEVQVAEAAARRAAEIIRDSKSAGLEVQHKGVIDLVTQIDLAAESAIREYLAQATPDIPVLAEEGGGAWEASTRWIVDPLDGTTNFVHDYPSYAVSIGLEVDGVLTAGCVFDAVHGLAYTASRGEGAWCGEERLSVSSTSTLDTSLLVTGFPYDRREAADRYLRYVRAFMIASQGLRRAGAAAMDFVALARGQVDGYWEFNLNPWDIAAGVLLVQEAGGRVTDMEGGPLDLEHPRLLATNGAIHQEMGKVLRELIASE